MSVTPSELAVHPVTERERVQAMDVIRGVALFGILVVNMDFFAGPFTAIFNDERTHALTGSDAGTWWTVQTLFQGKFVSQFSFLFGAGIALQAMRSDAVRGAMRTSILLLRRLLFLGFVGALHATLVWYGDILFTYASLGWTLILARFLPTKVLAWIGACFIVLAMACSTGLSFLQVFGAQMQEAMAARDEERAAAIDETDTSEETDGGAVAPATEPGTGQGGEFGAGSGTGSGSSSGTNTGTDPVAAPDGAAGQGADADDDSPQDDRSASDEDGDAALAEADVFDVPDAPTSTERFFDLCAATQFNIVDPRWEPFEIATYRHGPTEAAVLFRSLQWITMIPIMFVGFGPHLLGMFLLGTAAARAGLLRPTAARLQRNVAVVCIPVGIALSAVVPTLLLQGASHADALIAGLAGVNELGMTLLALGYSAALARLAAVGPPALSRFLSQTGRMAFTIYLTMSVTMTGLFYWWGFGLFDQIPHTARFAIAVITWLVLACLAQLWMRSFAMGPLEWIWRMVTYLEVPPLVRRPGAGTEAP